MKLLGLKPEEIEFFLAELATDAKAITKEVANICWYMRGSVNWDQAWRLTPQQREAIVKLIKSNIERTEKSGMALL